MTNKTQGQARLKGIMGWRKIEIVAPYPESSMPQNDMVISESAGKEYTFEYRHTEAQIGN
jgi:hypothetical protein